MTAKKPASTARIAVITGAASGIGQATAALLLENGWKVALFDANETALGTTVASFGKSKSVHSARLNVTDEGAVEKAIAVAAEALGGVDGVVNSAGIAADKHVFDTSAEVFRKILDVNVVGTFIVAKAAARIMRHAGGGSIVNIASISGIRGSKGRSAYGASKGAVITLTKVMATDLAAMKIRVNAIAPGPVETPMVKALHTDDERRMYDRFVPMRRYAEPVEIANAIEFLLDGRRSSYITGEILAVDGGFRGAGAMLEK
jgi:NAD(P)-dependent dehydrogenase (short-subunit alcohol dehydrogenase family)